MTEPMTDDRLTETAVMADILLGWLEEHHPDLEHDHILRRIARAWCDLGAEAQRARRQEAAWMNRCHSSDVAGSELQEENAALRAKNEELDSEYSQLSSSYNGILEKKLKAEKENAALRDKVDFKDTKIDKLRHSWDQTLKENATLRAEWNAMFDKGATLQRANESLRKTLSFAEDESEAEAVAAQKIVDINQRLRSDLASTEAALEESEAEVERLRRKKHTESIRQLCDDLDEKDAEIERLTQLLTAASYGRELEEHD